MKIRESDLPLIIQKWKGWMLLILFALFAVLIEHEMGQVERDPSAPWLIRVVLTIMLYPILIELGRGVAKFSVVPAGISVTLFGKKLLYIPQEEIRLLLGFHYQFKAVDEKWIVISVHTLEELSELKVRKTPKIFLDARTRPKWTEDMAEKYLRRYSDSVSRMVFLTRKDILLVEWSEERLNMLRKMYPEVPWVDLSDKKILSEKQ